MSIRNLTGEVFGRWTVLKFSHRTIFKATFHDQWLCQCSCDIKTTKSVDGPSLLSGDSKSCGCMARERDALRIAERLRVRNGKDRLKRGAIHPVSGLIFDAYTKRGENWLTPERYALRTEYHRNWAMAHRHKDTAEANIKAAEYRNANRGKYRERSRRASAKRRSDPVERMRCNLRSRLWAFLKLSKNMDRPSKTVGCTKQTLKAHIESQFIAGMSWDNYGCKHGCWSVDHTIPLSSAKSVDDLMRLVHYLNLAPMWHVDNIRKNNRLDFQMFTRGPL